MIAPAPGKRRARFILPGLYLALALYGWIDFARTAHDGLAKRYSRASRALLAKIDAETEGD